MVLRTLPVSSLVFASLAACGPTPVAIDSGTSTGGSSSGSGEPGSSSGDITPTTTLGSSGAPADTSTSTSTDTSSSTSSGTTEGVDATSTTSTSEAETTTSSTTSTTSTTDPVSGSTTETPEEPCPEGEVVCQFSDAKVCDGMGGFKQEMDCVTSFCADGVGCIDECERTFVAPSCPSGHPRIMVILDASSSTLNIVNTKANPGEGAWDLLRDFLASPSEGLFHFELAEGPLEDHAYIGLSVFGHNVPDESKLVVQYGACNRDAIGWALDPRTSCAEPGCADPWADAPIEWTFQDGAAFFGEPVISHMPTCQKHPTESGCIGSGTYVHLGLQFALDNLLAYKAACALDPAEPCDESTQFINLLVFDGQANSKEADYAPLLTALHEQGVVTHVVGFGASFSPFALGELEKMASYGSGGTLSAHNPKTYPQFEQALAVILGTLDFSGC